MIDDQNMYGKKKSTDQNQKFSFSNSKSLSRGQAKKIKTAQRQNDSDPDKRAAFFSEKNADYRNDDNITGSNKSGFSYSCVFDSKLLKITCQAENDATADTARDQDLLIGRCLWSFFSSADFGLLRSRMTGKSVSEPIRLRIELNVNPPM